MSQKSTPTLTKSSKSLIPKNLKFLLSNKFPKKTDKNSLKNSIQLP